MSVTRRPPFSSDWLWSFVGTLLPANRACSRCKRGLYKGTAAWTNGDVTICVACRPEAEQEYLGSKAARS